MVEHLQPDHIFEITTHVCIYFNTRSHPRGHLLINKGREAERFVAYVTIQTHGFSIKTSTYVSES